MGGPGARWTHPLSSVKGVRGAILPRGQIAWRQILSSGFGVRTAGTQSPDESQRWVAEGRSHTPHAEHHAAPVRTASTRKRMERAVICGCTNTFAATASDSLARGSGGNCPRKFPDRRAAGAIARSNASIVLGVFGNWRGAHCGRRSKLGSRWRWWRKLAPPRLLDGPVAAFLARPHP